ncbi:MAG: RNA polymerase sigma factor [Peptococcaceae bacterium]|nr:RNA polymerase sigma factor [Peptococcaceae bacterium]
MRNDTFDDIYAANLLYVRRFLIRLCSGNEFKAEELTQETFFQAYRSIHRFEGACQIKTWLCSIAHKVYCASLRKERRQKRVEAQAISEFAGYSLQDGDSLERDVISIMNQLPSLTSKVLLYRLFRDIPYSEISRLLGISENSAKVIYHRGRVKLKEKLKENGYEM